MSQLTSILSSKGQVVIPAPVRKQLGLEKGSKISFEVKGDRVIVKKLPTALDWSNLIKDIPVEDVEFDDKGNYDPKKSPEFHDWMVNG